MTLKYSTLMLLLLIIVVGCKNDGITKEELKEWIELTDLEGLNYTNDSLKTYIQSTLSNLFIYNSLPIKKPQIEYRYKKRKDSIAGIKFFHSDKEILLNKRSSKKPILKLSTEINSKDYYSVNYIHSYKGKLIESITSDINQIKHSKLIDSIWKYRIYNPKGEFLEIGFVENKSNSIDTAYMDQMNLIKSVLYDSSELLIQTK